MLNILPGVQWVTYILEVLKFKEFSDEKKNAIVSNFGHCGYKGKFGFLSHLVIYLTTNQCSDKLSSWSFLTNAHKKMFQLTRACTVIHFTSFRKRQYDKYLCNRIRYRGFFINWTVNVGPPRANFGFVCLCLAKFEVILRGSLMRCMPPGTRYLITKTNTAIQARSTLRSTPLKGIQHSGVYPMRCLSFHSRLLISKSAYKSNTS